ncbi:hypothetical protein WJX81_002271 [Elliptochloris bilobata]|uniref:Large ribosomal subunit protein uL6 alpha-beta domain-containing protein n=1 Tax=Elliptochloris bilobata TaxID=381761 RepID=A0AAW1RH26_9CHLO
MSALRSAAAAVKKAVQHASVSVPPNVRVAKQADQLVISGPLGTNRMCLSKLDSLGVAAVRIAPETRSIDVCSSDKAFFGTIQSLLKNKIQGVTRGYLVYLRMVGIGYRASLEGQVVTLKVGFSHDVRYTLPDALRAFLPEPTLIGLYGIDKNQVTQAAAKIIQIRPPSVYKGKGIRLEGTTPRIKAGKRK